MTPNVTSPSALLLYFFVASCSRPDPLSRGSQPPKNNSMPASALMQREATLARLPIEGRLPSLEAATGWINSPPLSPASLRGKVVLVQFWTYSCINWRRTMPYVRAWSEKYAASGLVVLGVHTPEFDFEKDLGNVQTFLRDANLTFPIALDSRRAIWGAFNNEYWPALYFVDVEGRVRHHQFGEGGYELSESVIKELLAETGKSAPSGLITATGSGVEAPADWVDLGSGENYLGYERTQGFLSTLSARPGPPRTYPAPPPLQLNQWSPSGEWTLGAEVATLNGGGGRITYRFHARDLHLVMGPAKLGAAARFRVRLDGRAPGEAHGLDVDEQGNGTVSEPRMYQLIRQPLPIADRNFEIEFLDAPVEAFSFTFG
jgi:thiol-disulfide isomerase/thioredoxin